MAAHLRLHPGRVRPADMTDREWARFASEAIADHYKSGQTDYDTGEGFFLGDHEGTPKFSLGDSAGRKITWDGTTLSIVGDLVLGSGNFFRSGQTAYDTGEGFWLGNDSGTPKLSIGDSAGNKLTWDGTDLTIVGDIMLGSGNVISSGQTAFNTGTGFWIGNDAGTPKFSIGNSAGSRLTWDGTDLEIFGVDGIEKTIDNLVFKGDSDTNPSIGQLLGSAVSTSNGGGTDEWQALRTIVTNFTGTFRLRVEAQEVVTGGGGGAIDGGWRLKNGAGTVVHTEVVSASSYADTFSDEETVTEAGETWTLEGRSQTDLSTYVVETQIRDIEVRARMNHATVT